MRIMFQGLALTALLLVGPKVSADYVIDNFTTAFPTQTDGVTSAAQSTGVNGVQRRLKTFSQVTSSGSTITVEKAGNRSFELVYDLQSPTDLNSINNVLKFSYSANNTGNGAIGFSFIFSILNNFNPVGTGGTTVLASVTKDVPFGQNSGTVSVSASEFGNGLVMSTVRYLSVHVNRPNPANGGVDTVFDFSGQSFTAVPEPATLSLLGLTGIAGVIAHRRARKSKMVA